MGRDLIVSALAHRGDRTLNWQAGHALIDSMAEADLPDDEDFWLTLGVDELEPAVGVKRNAMHAMLRTVEESMGWRTTASFTLYPWTLWVHGGDTWGDSPTDAFDAWGALWDLPDVMEAVGFEWPTTPEVGPPVL